MNPIFNNGYLYTSNGIKKVYFFDIKKGTYKLSLDGPTIHEINLGDRFFSTKLEAIDFSIILARAEVDVKRKALNEAYDNLGKCTLFWISERKKQRKLKL